ncbi:hypothetical protein EV188_103722 [Actinomycetospora succinea]|uniref:Polyketide cyclase/dehydrase/lipid transport protein n=1 Tax=Actinomycetospora succinea TaxID=663603 RepID=A0A4R6VP78_9PSEU|nr:hypothetical protein [Actinomycetospora succinea]TDQ61215.1 hypothetical protein EV188_103722 [Actinomycetospora succinea]
MARRVVVPERVDAMGLLDRVDYGDAFATDCPPEVLARFTPEELADLAVGRAPRWLRLFVRFAHRRVLGLRLTHTTPPVPLDWHLVSSGPDEVVYGVAGGLITPRLLVMKEPGRVLVVFLMRVDRPVAAPIVAVVKPIHRAIARYLLDRGARLAASELAPHPPRSSSG